MNYRARSIRAAMSAAPAFLAASLYAQGGHACSCGDDWGRADAAVVLSGTAIEVHEPSHLRVGPTQGGLAGMFVGAWVKASMAFDPDVKTVLRVNQVWKGTVTQFVTVNTGSGLCCDCSLGKVFDEGNEYVVYADEGDGEIYVGLCGGQAVAKGALSRAELDTLSVGRPPPSGARTLPLYWRHLLVPFAITLPIALLAMLRWRWLRAQRRRST